LLVQFSGFFHWGNKDHFPYLGICRTGTKK
jgi:hypothetical protein